MRPQTEIWGDLSKPAAPLTVSLAGIPGMTSMTRVLKAENQLPAQPFQVAEELANCASAAQLSDTAASAEDVHKYLVSKVQPSDTADAFRSALQSVVNTGMPANRFVACTERRRLFNEISTA